MFWRTPLFILPLQPLKYYKIDEEDRFIIDDAGRGADGAG
jgi:hypothetical protein